MTVTNMTGPWPAWVKALTLACAAATLWAVLERPLSQSVLNAVVAVVAWLVFMGVRQQRAAEEGESGAP